MDGIIKAFEKLSIRDKLVFLAVIVLVACGAFAFILSLGSKGLEKGDFPESGLARIADAQEYKRVFYDDLPLQLFFPGTTSSIYIGGNETMATDKGSCIAYDDDFSVIAFLVDRNLEDVIKNEFPVLLEDEGRVSYEMKVSDDGYMNALGLHYEGGVLRLSKGPVYVLTYVKGIEGFSVVTREKAKLDDAKKLLDRIAKTFGSEEVTAPVNDGAEGMASADDSAEASDVKETEKVYSKDAMEWPGDGVSAELNSDYHVDMTVKVDRDIDHAVFVFDYVHVNSMPEEVLLVGPYGEGYVPTYCNEKLDGRIVFEVDNPSWGEWTISLADNAEYGDYIFSVMTKEEYEEEVQGCRAQE